MYYVLFREETLSTGHYKYTRNNVIELESVGYVWTTTSSSAKRRNEERYNTIKR